MHHKAPRTSRCPTDYRQAWEWRTSLLIWEEESVVTDPRSHQYFVERPDVRKGGEFYIASLKLSWSRKQTFARTKLAVVKGWVTNEQNVSSVNCQRFCTLGPEAMKASLPWMPFLDRKVSSSPSHGPNPSTRWFFWRRLCSLCWYSLRMHSW